MTIEDVLAQMLERFDGGRRWAPCHAADAEGRKVDVWGGEAKRQCVIAMAASITRGPCELLIEVQERIRRAVGLEYICELPDWNDAQVGFGSIRAVLLAAIENGK